MCYLLLHVILSYIYVCVFVNVESKKTKCDLFAERGRRHMSLCQEPHAITLGNSGKNFPRPGVPRFAECSCTGRSTKKFLCREPHAIRSATLGKNFPRSGVPRFAECSCTGRSAKNFLKKIKNRLCRRPCQARSAQDFLKKK
jgi:hypothetical protein